MISLAKLLSFGRSISKHFAALVAGFLCLSLAACLNDPQADTASQDPKDSTVAQQQTGNTTIPPDTVSWTPKGCPDGYIYVAVLWNGPGYCQLLKNKTVPPDKDTVITVPGQPDTVSWTP